MEWVTFEQMLQRDPQRVGEERHQNVCLDTRLDLMKQGTDREFALQCAEGGLGFGELDVLAPKFFGGFALQMGSQQVGAFAGLAPGAAVFDGVPIQNQTAVAFGQLHFVEVRHLGIPCLNPSQPPFDF